jgi:ABC-type glycerol-3-phosphate transport system substrate-binding protein
MVCSSVLGASDPISLIIAVNNETVRTYTQSQLEQYSYSIPNSPQYHLLNSTETPLYTSTETPTINSLKNIQGITLDELAPIMADVWELTLEAPDGTTTRFSGDSFAENLPTYVWCTSDRTPLGPTIIAMHGEMVVSHGTTTQTAETELNIWLSWEGVPQIKAEIERYAHIHDISIQTLEVPKIATKLIQTQRGGGTVPDIVMVQADYMFELVTNDLLQALNYMRPNAHYTSGIDSFQLFGSEWAIPFYYDSQLLLINSSIFKTAGIDAASIRTLGDLEAAASTIRDLDGQTIVPLAWNLYSAYWLLPFQLGFGKQDLIENDGRVIVTDAPTKSALTYLKHLIAQNIVSIHERDAMFANFTAGRTAMMLSSSYMIGELEQLGIDFQVIAFPLNQATNLPIAPLLDYKALAITKRSRNPLVARRLIQYLTGIGVQQRLPLAIDKLPAAKEAITLEAYSSPQREVLKTTSRQGYALPPDVGYAVYKGVMWDMLRFILTGQIGIEEGLAKAQQLIQRQISDQLALLPAQFQNKAYSPTNQTQGATIYEQESQTKSTGSPNTSIPSQPEADTTKLDSPAPVAASDSGGFFQWLRKFW